MDELDYWRLCESLSIYQAAALIVGAPPSGIRGEDCAYLCVSNYIDNEHELDPHFQAAVAALTGAIRDGVLKAKIRVSAREYGTADALADIEYNEILLESGRGRTAEEGEILSDDGSFFYKPFPDWNLTTVNVNDLRTWLASRGFKAGFFFSNQEESQAGYLDKNHPNYAPRLAAAIRAWEAVTIDEERLRGRTPKAALSKWLNEHAAEYGLTKDDGTPSAQGVEETAKVANWRPEGGPGKTPGGD